MLLGDVTQAAPFVAVQGAFNWLIDNFSRLAECLSSAGRVGNLLMTFDRLEATERPTASADVEARLFPSDGLADRRTGEYSRKQARGRELNPR
jgi:vitamin B12/bleomycin/antimicrobial peptide transport system ATP-binding/permease protein